MEGRLIPLLMGGGTPRPLPALAGDVGPLLSLLGLRLSHQLQDSMIEDAEGVTGDAEGMQRELCSK